MKTLCRESAFLEWEEGKMQKGTQIRNLGIEQLLRNKDAGLITGSGRSPGGENGNPLQYSCLENSMDKGAWRAPVHGVAKSQIRLKQLSTHTQEMPPSPT